MNKEKLLEWLHEKFEEYTYEPELGEAWNDLICKVEDGEFDDVENHKSNENVGNISRMKYLGTFTAPCEFKGELPRRKHGE